LFESWAGFVRTALTISAFAHALLWVSVALPSAAPLAKHDEKPIMVEIVSPDEIGEAPKAQEPAKAKPPDVSTSKRAEPEPSPSPQRQDQAQQRPETPRPQPEPARSAPAPQAAQAASKPDRPQAWSTWLDTALGSTLVTASSGSDLVENAANLSPSDIATFKARLQECWKPPAGLAKAEHLVVVLRVSLQPNGALTAEPALLAASASSNGASLMQTAMRALRQCQPYGFLPAAKYEEWKVLDLAFSPSGPTALPTF
jgi:hypothetical protein